MTKNKKIDILSDLSLITKELVLMYPNFPNKQEINKLIKDAIREISILEETSQPIHITHEEAKKIKAVWVLSGSGTYSQPLTNSPSDQQNKDKKWYPGTDKSRLELAFDIINQIANTTNNQNIPILIYNGIKEQIDALITASKNSNFPIPRENIYIPPGEITQTIDQVKRISLPPKLNLGKDDLIAIVSHAPHLVRTLRILNQHKTLPVKIILFPLMFSVTKDEQEYTTMEIKGIMEYISKNEASKKSYPYRLPDQTNNQIDILPLKINDTMHFFNLSNQKSIRKNSFSSDKIIISDHKKWFESKLNNANACYFKAQIGKKYAGQIRFDITETQATIGVAVDENFRGMGIANYLIKEGIKKLKVEHPEIKQIIAQIKERNNPSTNLFKKNGFTFSHNFIINGQNAIEMHLQFKNDSK